MALELPRHGGDLKAAEGHWGRPAEGWLDLSTGINPWPYPLPALTAEAWARLPGAAEDERLREAAARRFGCRPDQVLAAPGTSALIAALPRLMPAGKVAILSPTYAEHGNGWRAAGHTIAEFSSLTETGGADVLVAVNPNNPDGRVLAAADLLARDEQLVVVDEAFADAAPENSVAGHLRPGLVVLRSFGKFYGLAGLRLGFALAEPELLGRLAARLGPWPVSGIALAVGTQALADDDWAAASRAHLASMAARLDGVLARAGCTIVGGTSLFRLAAHADVTLYDRLGRAGILVRAFAGRPGLLRFGLPPDEAGLGRLARVLLDSAP
jgi:cobalamin biosynthetic protein CobC